MALTEKQKRFVAEYLIDLNATQAAIRAGYKNADIGRQLITKNNVSAAIQAAMGKRAQRTEITQDRVLEELARVAFTNGAEFARVVTVRPDDDGPPIQCVELTETDQLTPEKRAAISGIKQTKFGIEVAACDKLKALELLGRHLGLFDGKGTGAGTIPEDDPITQSLKEAVQDGAL